MRQRNIEVAGVFVVGLAQGGLLKEVEISQQPSVFRARDAVENIHLKRARGVRYEGKTERQLDVPDSPFKLGLHPLKTSGAHVEPLTHLDPQVLVLAGS